MLTRNSVFGGCSLLVVTLGAVAGCTDPDPTGPGMMMHEEDTVAPTVASTFPAAQTTGVGADTKIIVTFSEPMDPASVEASYGSEDLLVAESSWSWNEDQTVLTISPDFGLDYAEGAGNDPAAVPAKIYKITIGGGAYDLAGNPLGADYELMFTTKKRISTAFTLDPDLTRVKLGGTLLGQATDIQIGDNAVKNRYQSFISFDIQKLPAGAVIEYADFSARQLAPTGYPYGQLGPVQTHHVSFADLNGLGALQSISEPGMYSDNDGQTKSIDVTSQVGDDYANRVARGDRSQYRLTMDTPTNNDDFVDKATFSLATFSMAVVYIAD